MSIQTNLAGPRLVEEPRFSSSPFEPELPPVERIEDIDLTDPLLYLKGDPHAVWKLLREQAPVFWHEKGARGTRGQGFWAVTTYEGCTAVHRQTVLNAAMTGEIIGGAGRSPAREVGWRADNCQFDRSHDPDGNHIRRDAVLNTYPGVESLRHDIDRLVAHVDLEVDLRVGRQEAVPYRHDHRRRSQMAHRVDPQTTRRMKPILVQIVERAGDLIHCRPQLIKQTPASVGHRHTARRPVQQARPETLLQLPHRMAERRGCDIETRCRGTEAPLIGNSDESG